MATTTVIERPIDPAVDDLETLLNEHRYWRARLHEAIQDSRRVRTQAAAVRQYNRDISSPHCLTCGRSFERPMAATESVPALA